MDLLCNRDKIRNVYTLKSTVLTHSWKKWIKVFLI
jgi:hypothetical protein